MLGRSTHTRSGGLDVGLTGTEHGARTRSRDFGRRSRLRMPARLGWSIGSATAFEDVRDTVRTDVGLAEAYDPRAATPEMRHLMLARSAGCVDRAETGGLRHTAGRIVFGTSLTPRRSPARVGLPAPPFHARTPKKRDIVVSQPLSGEAEQFPAGFPRFRYKLDSKLHEKTNSVVHTAEGEQLHTGIVEVASPPLRRSRSARSARPSPLSRGRALALAVRGWHAETDHAPRAVEFLEDALAGCPSPLSAPRHAPASWAGMGDAPRPSSVGGQRGRRPHGRCGERCPSELDRTLRAVRESRHRSTKDVLEPSEVIRLVGKNDGGLSSTARTWHDRGLPLRSQHMAKRALNSTQMCMSASMVERTHKEWAVAAERIQGRFRLRRAGRVKRTRVASATTIQKVFRGKLSRLAQQARKRAATKIQKVERGRLSRKLTAMEQKQLRAARLEREHQAQVDHMMRQMSAQSGAAAKLKAKKARLNEQRLEEERERREKLMAERRLQMGEKAALEEEERERAKEERERLNEERRMALVCHGHENRELPCRA